MQHVPTRDILHLHKDLYALLAMFLLTVLITVGDAGPSGVLGEIIGWSAVVLLSIVNLCQNIFVARLLNKLKCCPLFVYSYIPESSKNQRLCITRFSHAKIKIDIWLL